MSKPSRYKVLKLNTALNTLINKTSREGKQLVVKPKNTASTEPVKISRKFTTFKEPSVKSVPKILKVHVPPFGDRTNTRNNQACKEDKQLVVKLKNIASEPVKIFQKFTLPMEQPLMSKMPLKATTRKKNKQDTNSGINSHDGSLHTVTGSKPATKDLKVTVKRIPEYNVNPDKQQTTEDCLNGAKRAPVLDRSELCKDAGISRSAASKNIRTVELHGTEKCLEISSGQSTPLSRRLRPCTYKNYRETSESSLIKERLAEPLPKDRVPIYKRVLEPKPKENLDPYELDISDSDKELRKKKKRKLAKREASAKFDKTMYEALRRLEKREKKTGKSRPKTKENAYENNIKVVLQKVMKKVNFKKGADVPKVTRDLDSVFDKLAAQKSGARQVQASTKVNIISDVPIPNLPSPDICDNYFAQKSPRNCQIQPGARVNIISDVAIPNLPSPDIFADADNCIEYSDDEYFGFDEDDAPETVPDKSIGFPSFARRKPEANSTMLVRHSPWRINARAGSNYCLHYKKNSLPCLRQDALVDFRLAEKIEEQCSKSASRLEVSRLSPVQTSILDYIDTSRDQENTPRSSLFDYEEFNVAAPRRNATGRKVLGEIVDNRVAESTPVKNAQSRTTGSPDVSVIENRRLSPKRDCTFFGFDDSDSDETGQTPNRPREAKPFRIDHSKLKRYRRRFERKRRGETLENGEETSENVVGAMPSILRDDTARENKDEEEERGLFDDVEPELLGEVDGPVDNPKKRRKNRLLSEDGEGKRKKKKKDMMTKAEKVEFEKWASQFNSMCAEIDEHELEID